VTSGRSSDRYEPLPGLLELPGFLIRKIPRRARRPAAALAGVVLVGVAVGVAVSVPAITDSKKERSAAEQRTERERLALRTAELQAEMRLRSSRGTPARGLEGAAAIAARHALAADLAAAVLSDAVERVRAGEFTGAVDRVECERFPRGAHGEDPARELGSPTGRYSCVAVTADTPATDTSQASILGYPYRARVHFPSGRFAFCKVSGRPGEGALEREEVPVRLPAACGGSGA
jgi:hypothetical protein